MQISGTPARLQYCIWNDRWTAAVASLDELPGGDTGGSRQLLLPMPGCRQRSVAEFLAEKPLETMRNQRKMCKAFEAEAKDSANDNRLFSSENLENRCRKLRGCRSGGCGFESRRPRLRREK